MFLLAQELLKKNKSKQGKPSKHYPFNLMQGLMICPYTGVKFNLRNEIPNKNTGRILSYFTNSNIHKMGKELETIKNKFHILTAFNWMLAFRNLQH